MEVSNFKAEHLVDKFNRGMTIVNFSTNKEDWNNYKDKLYVETTSLEGSSITIGKKTILPIFNNFYLKDDLLSLNKSKKFSISEDEIKITIDGRVFRFFKTLDGVNSVTNNNTIKFTFHIRDTSGDYIWKK